MIELSRMQKTIRNTMYGISTQIITVLISFVTRTVFIKYLSVEYLGVNGLFTNILTVLSLAELGFDGAMVYSMYQPLAVGDRPMIKSLVVFYSKIYKIIGFSVSVLGLLLVPFLELLIRDTSNIENLTVIYLLFLLNSVASYTFVYKRSILQADQMQYVISKNYMFFNVVRSFLQIVIIIIFQNYIFYLSIQVISTILENLNISRKVNHLYPYLKDNNKSELDEKERKSIWSNVKALMIYKVGSTILDGTDNIIISVIIGVAAVGYLSNYTLVIAAITMVLQQLTNSITGSVGNYVATENIEKQEGLLYTISFVYFIVFGFSFVALFMLLNPFISLWIGEDFTLPIYTVFVISFNWYITGMMNPIWTFRATKGLFIYGKYRPAVSAVINVIVSVFLAIHLGLLGVLLGTTITRLSTNSWYDPYIVFKYGFSKSPYKYYITQILYFISLMIIIIVLSFLFNYYKELTYFTFLIKVLLTTSITLTLLTVCFMKTGEFKYLKSLIRDIIVK